MTEAERLAERLEELLAKANLPWRVQKEALPNRVGVTAANHEFITWAMENGWKANLIVEAVNALPVLITALRSQAEELERLRRALRETQKPKLITPVAVLNDDGSQSFSSQALGEM